MKLTETINKKANQQQQQLVHTIQDLRSEIFQKTLEQWNGESESSTITIVGFCFTLTLTQVW